ncbi:MAG: hypothetical protein ACKPHU_00615, partial [Planctomycetaceae bacterium]
SDSDCANACRGNVSGCVVSDPRTACEADIASGGVDSGICDEQPACCDKRDVTGTVGCDRATDSECPGGGAYIDVSVSTAGGGDCDSQSVRFSNENAAGCRVCG